MRKNNDEKCRGAKQSENSYEMKQKAKKKRRATFTKNK